MGPNSNKSNVNKLNAMIGSLAIWGLSACVSTTGNIIDSTNFDKIYNGAVNGTEFEAGDLSIPQHSGVNVYARNSCRFTEGKFEESLGPGNIITDEIGLESILASTAASILVDGVSAVFKAAGEGAVDETVFQSSFKAAIKPGPKCFEISKNSPDEGQFVLEMGLQQSSENGAFRLIPIFLAYGQKSKSHFFGGNKRALALRAAFSEPGGNTSHDFTINFGDWYDGRAAYFNKTAFTISGEDNISLAGPWFPLNLPQGVGAFNVTFTFIETTSQNKLAGILAAEIEERKADIETLVAAEIAGKPSVTLEEQISSAGQPQQILNTMCEQVRPKIAAVIEGNDLGAGEVITLNEQIDIWKEALSTTTLPSSANQFDQIPLNINDRANNIPTSYMQGLIAVCGAAS